MSGSVGISFSFGALHAAHLSRRHRWHETESRPWSIAEWTNALCGEAGEAANVAKKLLRHELGISGNKVGEDQAALLDKLGRELADTVHYAIIAAERAGVDLEGALAITFNEKSAQLGFPERIGFPQKVDQRPNGCTAACIATLTGIPLDELPHPPIDADPAIWFGREGVDLRNDYMGRLHDVLHRHGWYFGAILAGPKPRGFALAGGIGPRGVPHHVVVKDGELWHDPHESRAGLVSVESYDILIQVVP